MYTNPATATISAGSTPPHHDGGVGGVDSSQPPDVLRNPTRRSRGCSTHSHAPGGEEKALRTGLSLRFARTEAIHLPANHPDRKPGKRAHRRKTEFLRDTGANKTGFLGVKWIERHQRFYAFIRDHRNRNGAKVYCGTGKTAEDAARAYDRKARELYGSQAVLNFPGEGQP